MLFIYCILFIFKGGSVGETKLIEKSLDKFLDMGDTFDNNFSDDDLAKDDPETAESDDLLQFVKQELTIDHQKVKVGSMYIFGQIISLAPPFMELFDDTSNE